METTLRELLDREQFPLEKSVRTIRQILAALCEVYATRRHYSDLCPENIWVSPCGHRVEIDAVGGLGGTGGASSDLCASDLCAVGRIAAELLLGREAFQEHFGPGRGDDGAGELELRRLKWHRCIAEAPDLSDGNPELRRTFAEFVARLLGRPMSARFADAATALRELDAIAGTMTEARPEALRTARAAAASWTLRVRCRLRRIVAWRRGFAGAAVSSAALGLAIGYWVWPGGSAETFVSVAVADAAVHPQTFHAGSSPEEQLAALALCERHSNGCASAWYASETLREVVPGEVGLDATEVTWESFLGFVEATGYVTDAERRGGAYRFAGRSSVWAPGRSWRSEGDTGSAPVRAVSFNDARAFCDWSGGRLPSEEEWEFSARGYERRVFPWGDHFDAERAVWRQHDAPFPVASRAGGATPEGLYDLAGNVWEWTLSASGEAVLKGGSFAERNPAQLRAATRRVEEPDIAHLDDGFRCARDVAPADRTLASLGG